MAKKDDKQPDPQAQGAGGEAAEVGLLDNIIQKGRMARDEAQRPYARDLVGEFVSQVLDSSIAVSEDTVAMINQRIAQIDKMLTDQLNEIMHDADFQRLEASWRGLDYLVSTTETSTTLKLRLLNATKTEVMSDLEKAVEFDQSVQFKQLYEEEYGTFGGHPYSVLIGDYEFGRHPQDIAWLEKMSSV